MEYPYPTVVHDSSVANSLANALQLLVVSNLLSNTLPVSAPVGAEVLFPSEIPAQLKCNFGYTSNKAPCVSVNVEPLPFEPCNSAFKGLYF
ncbi:uncharacterized protein LOC126968203 [Leptidea sinapis]|uniref:uncharacterized protein LOC126968203 n=1 Tax=Leptidea sinapis TaxID=189913 RepID=UPI0021C25A40|nr:uncharacterized protein LOC126968203 [Leptidea sinapis]